MLMLRLELAKLTSASTLVTFYLSTSEQDDHECTSTLDI